MKGYGYGNWTIYTKLLNAGVYMYTCIYVYIVYMNVYKLCFNKDYF